MTTRRFLFPLIAAGMALGLWWCSLSDRRAGDGVLTPASRDVVVSAPATPPPAVPGKETKSALDLVGSDEAFPIVAPLNAASSTIARDLDTVGQILDAWRTNFPREGNPVGDNDEITAALLGGNSRKLALIPKNHPAINARGELCDRWGTPFRFHQLSGEHMEISSAGPDRKFGTADDAVWSPGS